MAFSKEDQRLIDAHHARRDELIRVGATLPEGRVLYLNQFSGSIRCLSCAGATLGAAIVQRPSDRTVHGMNGEPFTRLSPREARLIRKQFPDSVIEDDPLCECT